MTSANVEAEQAEGVLTITFNRPEKKNAFTLAMYVQLVEHLKKAHDDDAVRAVLFRGAGGTFTAGNDLGDFMRTPPSGADTPVFQLLLTLASYEKPLVAAVVGPAVGLGTTMLLHCDLAYAGESARFHMPFVDLGLVPEAASSLLLPRMMGHVRAAELLLLAERFDAAHAKAVGIINDVLPDAEVEAHALTRAKALAAKAPQALRASKRLLKQATADEVQTTMAREGEEFIRRLRSPEAAQAFAAFFARGKKG